MTLFDKTNCTYTDDEIAAYNQQWADRCAYYNLEGKALDEDREKFIGFIKATYPNMFTHVYPTKEA